MVVEMDEKMMEKIQNLRQYLPETSKEELEQILKYGEKIRAEWERKKKSFWSECGIYDI